MRVYDNEVKITQKCVEENSKNSESNIKDPNKNTNNVTVNDIKIGGLIISNGAQRLADVAKYENVIQITNVNLLVNTSNNINNTGIAKAIANDTYDTNDIVGYTIKNTGDFTIKGIIIPEYIKNKTTNKYEGSVKEYDLKPGEAIDIPTKWLSLLISRLEFMGCKDCDIVIPKDGMASLDEYFNSFVYYIKNNTSPIIVGAYNINNNRANIFKGFEVRYGYLENQSKLINIKVNSPSAIFLGMLLRK